jgi:hypothetical protein
MRKPSETMLRALRLSRARWLCSYQAEIWVTAPRRPTLEALERRGLAKTYVATPNQKRAYFVITEEGWDLIT